MIEILVVIVQVILAYVLWQQQKDKLKHEARIADIEAKREGARLDDANTASALTLAGQLVTAFEPTRLALAQIAEQFGGAMTFMRQVVERRDEDNKQAKEQADRHHNDIVARLERQQKQIEEITREVKVSDLPKTMRTEIALLVTLASNIGADVKSILTSVHPPVPLEDDKKADDPAPGETPAEGVVETEEKKV